jgi:hypothetical protein
MPESLRGDGQNDAVGRSAHAAWLWRLLDAAKTVLPTPSPTYADELRAVRLLRAHLTPEQLRQYQQDRSFVVVGGSTGRRYRITASRQMNVALLGPNGKWAGSLCFVPSGELPLGDIMLAQKIALELFEGDALTVARRASPPFHRVGAF